MYVVLFSSPIGVNLLPYVKHLTAQFKPSKCIEVNISGCYALSDAMVKGKIEHVLNNEADNEDKLVIISGALALDDPLLQARFNTVYFINVDSKTSKEWFINRPINELEISSPNISRRLKGTLTASDEANREKANQEVMAERERDWPIHYEPLNAAIYQSVDSHPEIVKFDGTQYVSDAVRLSLQDLSKRVSQYNTARCFGLNGPGDVDGAIFVMEF